MNYTIENENNFIAEKHFYYLIYLLLEIQNSESFLLELHNDNENIYFNYINHFFHNVMDGRGADILEIEIEYQLYNNINNITLSKENIKVYFIIKQIFEIIIYELYNVKNVELSIKQIMTICIEKTRIVLNMYCDSLTRSNLTQIIKGVNNDIDYKQMYLMPYSNYFNS